MKLIKAPGMIVDHRTYNLYSGATAEYFRLYEEEGLAVQKRHLVNLLGYYATETGRLNQVVHLWAYHDAGDRESKRAALQADPAWQAYLPKIRRLIISSKNKILVPAPFSTIDLQ